VSLPICVTCGVQFGAPADSCPVCEDPRQYVPVSGQQWTSLDALRADHVNAIRPEGAFVGIGTEPRFAIGQRALLVPGDAGNVLWDCVTLLDEATASEIERRGGLRAIAISHPHYYSTMVEWAHRFQCPVLLHADDREWVMRDDPALEFWSGETHSLGDGLTLIRCGGHFAGGTVLHRSSGDLLCGDIVQVIPDRGWVSFMYSFPNYIPLNASAVRAIWRAVEPLAFDRLYGAWWGKNIASGARAAFEASVKRYLAAISG
jgi:glyoxylase-like metal-dependent hydrolase (beta-lactamase superfamily II)